MPPVHMKNKEVNLKVSEEAERDGGLSAGGRYSGSDIDRLTRPDSPPIHLGEGLDVAC